MKNIASVIVALMLCVGVSKAEDQKYFRLMDISHPQMGAGVNFSLVDPGRTSATTDIALVTHSVKDGTIIPASIQPYYPPVAWTPLQLGLGGSFAGDFVGTIGTSGNLSPTLAAIMLRGVSKSSNPALQALKSALEGSSSGIIRLGFVFQGEIVRGGQFQSFQAMFPGEGFGDILYNALRLNTGLAWKF